MPNYGSYEFLQKIVEATENQPLPYAEPSDIYNFGENSNIIRSLKYPNGQPYGYVTNPSNTTQLVPEVSTSTVTGSANTSLSVTEDGSAFNGLNEIQLPGYYGHGVLGTLSIASDLCAIANSINVNANEISEGRDPLWLQRLSESHPELYRFLKSSTIDDLQGVPMLHDVANDVSYINEDGMSLAMEILSAEGLQSKKTYNDNAVPNFTQFYTTDGRTVNLLGGAAGSITKFVMIGSQASHNANVYIVSSSEQQVRYEVDGVEEQLYVNGQMTYGGRTFFYKGLTGAQWNDNLVATPLRPNDTELSAEMAYTALYGSYTYPDGYSEKEGGNTLDLNSYKGLSALEKLNKLAGDLPEWVSNAITTYTVNADGSTTPHTWLPVQLATDFNNNDVNDPFNTNGTQVFDGSYPSDIGLDIALKLPVLNALNEFTPYNKIYNPTIAPTPGAPTPPQPNDPTNPNETLAKVGSGVAVVEADSAGHAHVYLPTRAQVNALMNYLWDPDISLDSLKRLFSNPIDAIIGLQQIYFPSQVDGQGEIVLGNLRTGITNVNYTEKRFYKISMGSVSVKEYFGNVFDYDTNISIYLPFVGIVPLSVDNIMRTDDIEIIYNIDILTGAANVQIWVKRDNCRNVLYTYGCQTASQYPLSGREFGSQVMGIASIAVGVGTMVATGGVTAPAVTGILGGSAAANSSPSISKSGGFMGIGGLIRKTPYIILERVIPNMPVNYNHYQGYPYYKSSVLGNCKGFTKCGEVHLDASGISSREKDMIIAELQKGVIL